MKKQIDTEKIQDVATSIGMDLSKYEIVHEPDNKKAALKAVELVHDRKADSYFLLPSLIQNIPGQPRR